MRRKSRRQPPTPDYHFTSTPWNDRMVSRGEFTNRIGNAGPQRPGIPTRFYPETSTLDLDTERDRPMGIALWCDVDDPEMNVPNFVGHPFPDKDPDRKHFAQTEMVQVQTGNSYGKPTYQTREEITEEIEMCGYHRMKMNPFQARKALTNGEPKQPTLAELEEEDSNWRAGYEAAMEKILNRPMDESERERILRKYAPPQPSAHATIVAEPEDERSA